MWPGLRKSTMWAQKNRRFFPSLLYHNIRTICTNNPKSLSLLQILMGFLLKFTEMAYQIQNWRYKQKYNSVKFALTWLIFAGLVTNLYLTAQIISQAQRKWINHSSLQHSFWKHMYSKVKTKVNRNILSHIRIDRHTR